MKEKLLIYMEENHLDSFYISKPENVRYISGFTGADSYLVITRYKSYFLTDPRYTEQASYECPQFEIINWRLPGKNIGDAVALLVDKTNINNIGFESSHLTVDDYHIIEGKVGVELIPTNQVIEEFRSIKSETEIAYSKVACDIASRAFEKICKDIRVGITEKEIASKLSHYMVMEGADTQPYGGIVISGTKTSLLHGIPSSKSIEYGDLVLMDYGCQYKGYMSDMTRTVVVGKATQKQREVYELEKQMVADVEAVLKEGVTSVEAYEASIQAIKDTEYMTYHYTGIGHGVGLFVHEPPFMGANGAYKLESNNIVTVEPGIYIPGWGGIRIEDQVLITECGYENLITATKELIEL
ncbi:MAG: M24 family metallopeptidase [Lachnotalea sp.]